MSLSTMYSLIEPADLGLPSKFNTFRHAQREALEWLMDECQTRISAAQLPTGAGKTALAIALAKLLNVKAGYLVATKALQQQVLDDFSSMGLVDIRGRANYDCPNYRNCDTGYENECSLHDTSGCARSVAMEAAERSSLFVSNYACWLHSRKANRLAFEMDGHPPVGLLICDEAHQLENQLTSYAETYISADEIDQQTRSRLDVSGVLPDNGWSLWAQGKLAGIVRRKDLLKARHPNDYRKLDAYKDLDELEQRAKRIASMGANWAWQFDDRTGACTFQPINVSGFMDGLFSGVPRILMMSASLTTFQTNLLLSAYDAQTGLDPCYDYRAWSQVFPPQNSPCYHIPTKKLSWQSTDEDYQAVITTVDAVIDHRLERKHIIHTVSYARSRRALQHSRHKARFIWNENAAGLNECIDRFRRSADGILVTPSVEEGYDFPGRQAECQHFLKFPYPNETSSVIKERCKRISGYRLHSAAQRFYQMCGRARRFDADRCENFIYDNSVGQLKGSEGRSYLPMGFKIYTVNDPPPPPPRAPDHE